MKTEAKLESDYQLKGNPAVEVQVPIIGNLIYDELGELVLARHNERFHGINNIEDTTEYKRNQPLSYSNVPRILSYNQILQEETNGRIRVLSPEDTVQYWGALPEKNSTYADTYAIVIFPNEGPNEDLRQRVLEITKLQKTKIPLLVSGLGVERADNATGFTFVATDYATREAPFAAKDQIIAYDTRKGLIASSKGVNVFTPPNQSGLRGAYRCRDVGLYLWYDGLLFSYADGRVQVVQGPKGRAEKLEEMTRKAQELAQERDRQIAEINERYKKAEQFLKTGKL